ASRLPRNHRIPGTHEVQFYSGDSVLRDRLSHFVGSALQAGDVVAAFVTEPHRNSFIEGLQSNGLDVRAAMKQGTYKLLDVADAISAFMVNDSVDAVRYLEAMANLMESARKVARSKYPRLAVYGELAVPLLARRNVEAVLQIEQLSNEFAKEYDIDILCTYPVKRSRRKEAGDVLQQICAEHTTVHSE